MLRRRPTIAVSRTQAALFGLAIGLGAVALIAPIIPTGEDFSEGSTAPQTLVAQRSATYESQVLTDIAREESAKAVGAFQLPADPAIRDQQISSLTRFLDDVRTIRQRGGSQQQQLDALNQLDSARDFSASGRTAILALDSAAFDRLVTLAPSALSDVMSASISEVPPDQQGRNPAEDDRINAYLAELQRTIEAEPNRQTLTPSQYTALQELLRLFVVPNAKIDEARTKQAQEDARNRVQPQVVTYTRGQVIAGQGATLSAADVEALRETGYLGDGFDAARVASGAIMAAGLAALLAAFVYYLQPFSSSPVRRMLICGAAILAALAAARAILPVVLPDEEQLFLAFAIPVGTAAMVAVSFASLPFAAIVAVLVGLFAAFVGASATDLPGADFTGSLEAFELAAAYTAAGLVGALTLVRAERLSRFALAAATVALACGAVMVAFWLASKPHDTQELGWIALAAGLNGLLSAVLTVGCFVVLSLLFGVTTRLQLMELAQSEHPLLRRLQEEAPGTYHHSMLVGALAERGAGSIGADALIARVGAYYHDVGKLGQPHYYIENMLDGHESPHESLAPEQSAAIIRDHVTTGIDIARKYRLPGVVRDFIPQHHGTRLVTYFYRRAAQQRGEIDASDFRYPGPRPETKEAAIVMLADSCEAVVRASQLDDRARGRLDELVDNIFAERLAEGQLDDCDITMRELQEVASSFKATLRAVYHPRIEYPSPAPEEIAQLARNTRAADVPGRPGL